MPGLILGLIIGGVAGAFLPDFLGGPKLPAHTGTGSGSASRHIEYEGEADNSIDPETQKIIDDAMNQTQEDAQELGEDAADSTEAVIEDLTPAIDD